MPRAPPARACSPCFRNCRTFASSTPGAGRSTSRSIARRISAAWRLMSTLCRASPATASPSPGLPASWSPKPSPESPGGSMCSHGFRIAISRAAPPCAARRWCWRCCTTACGTCCNCARPPPGSRSQSLRDLYRVESRALQQLITRHEQADGASARIAQVLADAADENRVLTGGVLRHREVVALRVVHQLHARSALQQLAHLRRGDRPLTLESDRHRVRAQHRYPHAGGRDADVGIAEDLAGLLDDLGLLVVVAGHRVDAGVVAEEIERVRVRQHLVLIGTTLEIGARGLEQLLHRRGAGAGGGLVGGQCQPPDA